MSRSLVYASIQFAIRASAFGTVMHRLPVLSGCGRTRCSSIHLGKRATVLVWNARAVRRRIVDRSRRLETVRRTDRPAQPATVPSIIGDCHGHHSSLPAASAAAAAASLATARVWEDPVRIMSIRLSVRSNGVVSTWTELAQIIESIQKRALRVVNGDCNLC